MVKTRFDVAEWGLLHIVVPDFADALDVQDIVVGKQEDDLVEQFGRQC